MCENVDLGEKSALNFTTGPSPACVDLDEELAILNLLHSLNCTGSLSSCENKSKVGCRASSEKGSAEVESSKRWVI